MCHLCPHVEECCFVLSLRTGTVVIGIAYLIILLLSVAASVFTIVTIARLDKDFSEYCAKHECYDRLEEEDKCKCLESCVAIASSDLVVSKYGLAILALSVLTCVLLLVGVLLSIPVLLLVFLYGLTTLMIAFNVLTVSVRIYHRVGVSSSMGFLIVHLLWLLIHGYLCMVVYSLYRTMVWPEEYLEAESVVCVVSSCYSRDGTGGPSRPEAPRPAQDLPPHPPVGPAASQSSTTHPGRRPAQPSTLSWLFAPNLPTDTGSAK